MDRFLSLAPIVISLGSLALAALVAARTWRRDRANDVKAELAHLQARVEYLESELAKSEAERVALIKERNGLERENIRLMRLLLKET